ncbi:hypothetical protein H5410_049094 [Solanum commersonii]|uniref:Uncharacterized protein n=1 Tax=Solanum commersonii TaxID=4109 RepID=A0A9J5XMV3_SOLCO|nr:hypothetical protein H5410_049094 [Solanum commersonii]
MEPWETRFWYRSTLISYGTAFVFMVSDTILGPEDVKPMHNMVILFIFTNLLSLALHIHIQKMTHGSANLPNPISPALVNFSKSQGVILGWIVLFLQQHRVPAGSYLCGALISRVITVFCAVMLLRSIVTDMGIMYTLCSLSIGVSVRDHQLNKPTWNTFGFFYLLVYARTYLEHRAIVAAEKVAAAAERQSENTFV